MWSLRLQNALPNFLFKVCILALTSNLWALHSPLVWLTHRIMQNHIFLFYKHVVIISYVCVALRFGNLSSIHGWVTSCTTKLPEGCLMWVLLFNKISYLSIFGSWLWVVLGRAQRGNNGFCCWGWTQGHHCTLGYLSVFFQSNIVGPNCSYLLSFVKHGC
jgi:hypothetical protein